MRHRESVVLVTTHGRWNLEQRGWSTRPIQLARCLADAGREVTVIARTAPWKTAAALDRVSFSRRLGPVAVSRRRPHPLIQLVEHPFPAGRLERIAAVHAIRSLAPHATAVIVADPRSATILRAPGPWVRVFDAYDAWDLSPLYAGTRRLVQSIQLGYRRAAAYADLVVANTPFMADRMRALGARRVELLPNGAPKPHITNTGRRPRALYLGNIQRRLRTDLLLAAADAAHLRGTDLRIAGAVQDRPPNWDSLIAHPAVQYLGSRHGPAAKVELESATVGLIPHQVDDYSRSQDAMKAWDYLAYGLSVVSTSVPPASSIPGLATLADDAGQYGQAVECHLASARPGSSLEALIIANAWDRRAESLLALLDSRS